MGQAADHRFQVSLSDRREDLDSRTIEALRSACLGASAHDQDGVQLRFVMAKKRDPAPHRSLQPLDPFNPLICRVAPTAILDADSLQDPFHQTVQPPSMNMVCPVMKSEALEARNMTIPSSSSGLPHRFMGVRSMMNW